MTQGSIETVVARCLVDADFVSAFEADAAAALKSYGLDADLQKEIGMLHIEKVRRFSGFIGKVQHNYLWESFYGTRQLLRYYKIESDVFVEYRKRQLGLDAKLSREDRTRSFLKFLETDFIDSHELTRRYPCLLEVLNHERTIWEINQKVAGRRTRNAAAEARGWKEFQRLIPRVNGVVGISQYNFNPESVIELIRQKQFRGTVPRTTRLFLAYWKEPKDGRLRLLELDRLFVHILQNVGQKRSVRSMIAAARRGNLRDIRPAVFREFFDTASDIGLISFCRRGG